MHKILVVLLAYIMISKADYLLDEYYYLACSIVYSLVGIVSCLLPYSRLLTLYATINLMMATAHLFLNYWFYIVEYIVWNAALNLSLISEVVELMLILSGASSVFIFVVNHCIINTGKRSNGGYRMAKVK